MQTQTSSANRVTIRNLVGFVFLTEKELIESVLGLFRGVKVCRKDKWKSGPHTGLHKKWRFVCQCSGAPKVAEPSMRLEQRKSKKVGCPFYINAFWGQDTIGPRVTSANFYHNGHEGVDEAVYKFLDAAPTDGSSAPGETSSAELAALSQAAVDDAQDPDRQQAQREMLMITLRAKLTAHLAYLFANFPLDGIVKKCHDFLAPSSNPPGQFAAPLATVSQAAAPKRPSRARGPAHPLAYMHPSQHQHQQMQVPRRQQQLGHPLQPLRGPSTQFQPSFQHAHSSQLQLQQHQMYQQQQQQHQQHQQYALMQQQQFQQQQQQFQQQFNQAPHHQHAYHLNHHQQHQQLHQLQQHPLHQNSRLVYPTPHYQNTQAAPAELIYGLSGAPSKTAVAGAVLPLDSLSDAELMARLTAHPHAFHGQQAQDPQSQHILLQSSYPEIQHQLESDALLVEALMMNHTVPDAGNQPTLGKRKVQSSSGNL